MTDAMRCGARYWAYHPGLHHFGGGGLYLFLYSEPCRAVVSSGIEVGLVDGCDVVRAGRMGFRAEVEVLNGDIWLRCV